jgi:hypothetical protein
MLTSMAAVGVAYARGAGGWRRRGGCGRRWARKPKMETRGEETRRCSPLCRHGGDGRVRSTPEHLGSRKKRDPLGYSGPVCSCWIGQHGADFGPVSFFFLKMQNTLCFDALLIKKGYIQVQERANTCHITQIQIS